MDPKDAPEFPTGLLATRQAPARAFIDAKKKAKKSKVRPTRRAWPYTAKDGQITISSADLAWLMSTESREERDRFETALCEWYVEQGVCQEPYLPGESLEQYKQRTGSNG